MSQRGGHLLSGEKIQAVLESARHSTGVRPLPGERKALLTLCSELERLRSLEKEAEREVVRFVKENEELLAMSTAIGKASAAAVVSELGSPKSYKKAKQYLKAAGLNVKEKSSGKSQGGVHITKRGSSLVRRLLYLASLRLVKDNPVVRAW
jgi:transposase